MQLWFPVCLQLHIDILPLSRIVSGAISSGLAVSEMDGLVAPKPSSLVVDMKNLNFRFRMSFCFRSELYFWNNAYSTAFLCA